MQEVQQEKQPCSHHWKQLSDEQIVAVIHERGAQLCAEDVTLGYIRGMRNYKQIYTDFPSTVLSFLVRIDLKDGVKCCSCDHA